MAAVAAQAPVLPEAYAIAEGEKPANARIQLRGDPKNLGAEAGRKFPEILGGMRLPGDIRAAGGWSWRGG